LIQYTSVATRH